MVRKFDLPWQPVAKRKQRESFEEMSKDQFFTSPNYYQSLENNEDNNESNKPSGVLENSQKDTQTKNRKKLQILIEDISKTLSGQKI